MPDDSIFYRGTIVVLKDTMITPKGKFDKKYAMLSQFGGDGNFQMLDLHKSMGGIIILEMTPNVFGHYAVNKQGIRDWVFKYFELFFTKEGCKEWSEKIDDILYVEDLSDYFVQANRDIFIK